LNRLNKQINRFTGYWHAYCVITQLFRMIKKKG